MCACPACALVIALSRARARLCRPYDCPSVRAGGSQARAHGRANAITPHARARAHPCAAHANANARARARASCGACGMAIRRLRTCGFCACPCACVCVCARVYEVIGIGVLSDSTLGGSGCRQESKCASACVRACARAALKAFLGDLRVYLCMGVFFVRACAWLCVGVRACVGVRGCVRVRAPGAGDLRRLLRHRAAGLRRTHPRAHSPRRMLW